MKRRRIIVFALAVALAFAGSAGPRHARAATQNHDHAAAAEAAQSHRHSHDNAGTKHSHDHGTDTSLFAEGGSLDHADQPASDQGCCYAWCNSVAIIHAVDWLFIGTTHADHFASPQRFQIAAFSAAIDPPPR